MCCLLVVLFLVLGVCVLFVFGAVFGVFWFVFFGFLFCFLNDRDSAQDYVSVLHQFTFAATLQHRPLRDLINQLTPIATCY